MSNLRQASGEDYPDAARKNYLDARALMARRRYDGAAYLSGYVIECIIKTLIQVDQATKAPIIEFRHDLNKLSGKALALMALPSSRTARYFPGGSSLTTLPYDNPPAGWKETLRYYPEGTIPQPVAKTWLSESKRLYAHVLLGLRKDGEVTL